VTVKRPCKSAACTVWSHRALGSAGHRSEPGLVVVLGVKITGTSPVVDFWRRWAHDPAQPNNVRHESQGPREPLGMTDAAVLDYVVLINPAARGLSSVMHNIISLDGTSARRFGQVLLVGSRINGHNVALAAILGRTENGLNFALAGTPVQCHALDGGAAAHRCVGQGRRDHSRR
jgi:hypothetical protein